ncbi:MAG: ribosomal RNA small subunit methyltransferase E [Planctomycetota bacterium]|nr:MAG: ribosomal RNA small subunit methyltransferase E [Planctomycetota bacterium]
MDGTTEMNLILLRPEEVAPDGTVALGGRRARHILEVLRAAPGRVLRAGVLGGPQARAIVTGLEPGGRVRLRLEFDGEPFAAAAPRLPEPPPPVDLLLAVPRPRVLERVLAEAAAFGVGRVWLVRTWRVERSYLASRVLAPERLQAALVRGLEQAGTTALPQVRVFPRFRPFVEDELPRLCEPGMRLLLAEPRAPRQLRELGLERHTGRVLLAVGPEGGWLPWEIACLEQAGFEPFASGRRVLRVESAVVALLAQLAVLLPPPPGAAAGAAEARGRSARPAGAEGLVSAPEPLSPPPPPAAGGSAR